MKYKKLFYILLFWFVLYALTEFLMNFCFSEKTPIWKTILISLVMTTCTCYVLFKKNKNLSVRDLITYQVKEIPILRKIDKEFSSRLSESLQENKYLIIINTSNEIKFKNKSTFKSFGELFKILILDDKIIINSRPKLFTNIVSENAGVAEKIKQIENIINQNYR